MDGRVSAPIIRKQTNTITEWKKKTIQSIDQPINQSSGEHKKARSRCCEVNIPLVGTLTCKYKYLVLSFHVNLLATIL